MNYNSRVVHVLIQCPTQHLHVLLKVAPHEPQDILDTRMDHLTDCLPRQRNIIFYHAVNLTDIMALCPFQQLIIPWDIVEKWSMYFRAQVSCDTYSNYLMLAWDIGRALPGSFWWSLAAWPGGWAAEGYWTGLVTSVSLGPQPYDKPLPKYDQSWSDPPH